MDGWKSCQPAPSPATGTSSHWIQYDLGTSYQLGNLHVWNYNDPKDLNSGARKISIQTSDDGETWQYRGVHLLAQAAGSGFYEGSDLINLDRAEARYVLLTIVENYGGACYGIGEIRMDVSPVLPEVDENCFQAKVTPNPFFDLLTVIIYANQNAQLDYKLYNNMGQALTNGFLSSVNGQSQEQLDFSELPNGMYHLVIRRGDCQQSLPIIKQ